MIKTFVTTRWVINKTLEGNQQLTLGYLLTLCVIIDPSLLA